MLRIFKITGDSMSPAFPPNHYVLALTSFFSVKVNDIVVVNHIEYGRIIKRVVSLNANKSLLLGSDNPSGVSTEQIGVVQKHQVIAKVIWPT